MRLLGGRAHRVGVGERPVGVHADEVGAGQRERPRPRTRREHEPRVWNLLAALEDDDVRVGIDPLGAGAEPQLDHLVLVFLGRPDVGPLPFDLPAEKALGQRRPVVRRVGLGGDDRH